MISKKDGFNLDDPVETEDEAKTFVSSGGNTFLALNTTYLISYGILFGIAALAIIALMAVLGGRSSDTGYGSGYQRFGQQEHGQNFHHQRQKRGFAWDSGKFTLLNGSPCNINNSGHFIS